MNIGKLVLVAAGLGLAGMSAVAAPPPIPTTLPIIQTYSSQINNSYTYKDGYSGDMYPRYTYYTRGYQSANGVAWTKSYDEEIVQAPRYAQTNDREYRAHGDPFSGTLLDTMTVRGVVTTNYNGPITTIDVTPQTVSGNLTWYYYSVNDVYQLLTTVADSSSAAIKITGLTANYLFKFRLRFTVEKMAFNANGVIASVGFLNAAQVRLPLGTPHDLGSNVCYSDFQIVAPNPPSNPVYFNVTPTAPGVDYIRYTIVGVDYMGADPLLQ